MIKQVMEWIETQQLIAPGDRVIVGISGGADSVCLLYLLSEIQKKMDFTLEAVHIEHGIRGAESREDAAFVRTLCGRLHVPCTVYAVDVPAYAKETGTGLEEAARLLRYECYRTEAEKNGAGEAKTGADGDGTNAVPVRQKNVRVALAHHADDNAETLLFHLIRGSGLTGLAGMQAKRPLTECAQIIRPLLGVQRWEIEAYLKERGQEYRQDATNADVDYSRNRIRHHIMPELCRINGQAVAHMNRSAQLLQQAAEYLEQQAQRTAEMCLVREMKEDGARVLLVRENLMEEPVFLQKQVLYQCLTELAGSRKDIGETHVETLHRFFDRQVGRRLDLPYGMRAERVYDGIRLTKCRNPLTAAEQVGAGGSADGTEYNIDLAQLRRLEQGEEIHIFLPEGELRFGILDAGTEIGEIHKKKYTKWLNYDKIKNRLQIRKRKPGDYLVTDAAGHKKKLKEYFVNEKFSRESRDNIWLLTQESHVLWVIGGRISTEFKINRQTKKILEVQLVGGDEDED